MAGLARSGGAVCRPQLGKHFPHGATAAFLGPASYRQLRQTRLGLWIMDCAKNNSGARNIRTSHPYGLSHIYPHAICISICRGRRSRPHSPMKFVYICYLLSIYLSTIPLIYSRFLISSGTSETFSILSR